MIVLETISERSKTAKLWVDMLIKPLFIMTFVRAEREADWLLHYKAFGETIPYFFAAGHVNYARYGMCYLRSTEALPGEVLVRFMKGEHVMRHQCVLWNGIWSDTFIETAFMRCGHAPGGVIGIALKPATLKVWTLILHTCSRLEADQDEMTENSTESEYSKHKEEGKTRIANDTKDRECLKAILEHCTEPLNPDTHHGELVNIVTRQHSTEKVNVQNAVSIEQRNDFSKELQHGLYDTIQKNVITMID
jgi:hypothetical protein